MNTTIEYYEPRTITIKNKSGFGSYLDTKSTLVKTEEHPIDTAQDKEAVFRLVYCRNNSLRYCNGSHWVFVDKNLESEYRGDFMKRFNTISNYYGNGVVD